MSSSKKSDEQPTTEKPSLPDFPEAASVEFVCEHGNRSMIVWYPVTYYAFEHLIRGEGEKEYRPLPDTRDRSPREMPQAYEWAMKHIGRAQEIVSSTIPEVKEGKRVKKKDGSRKSRKRKK